MSRCCGRWLIILFLCFFCSCVVCYTVFRSVGESKNAINLTARKKVCLHARKMEKFLKWNKNISIAEQHNEQRFSFGESLYHITTPDHKRIFLILHSRLYLIKLFYGKWKYVHRKKVPFVFIRHSTFSSLCARQWQKICLEITYTATAPQLNIQKKVSFFAAN